jgi:hypothetical protein
MYGWIDLNEKKRAQNMRNHTAVLMEIWNFVAYDAVSLGE